MIKRVKRKVCFLFMTIMILCCNKNTDQLSARKAPPTKLVISSKTNGLADIDFIFEQTKIANGDTVWLSVKNTTTEPIINLKYVVELCKAVPKNYDNCDLQIATTLTSVIQAGSTLEKVFMWVNKGISLDQSLINTGVISYSGLQPHPLGNVYSNIYAVFEAKNAQDNYYGILRGYILADGSATFRIKGRNDEMYDATGLFTLKEAYDGILKKGNDIVSPFSLDSIQIGNTMKLIDETSDGKITFRMKLRTPVKDTTVSLLVYAKKLF